MKTNSAVLPSIEILKANFVYCPETGVFTNRIDRARTPKAKEGMVSGYISKQHGYRILNVGNKSYLGHRVAWAMTHCEWPTCEIDHKNNVRTDNRIANLREATKSENRRNLLISKRNTSGIKGVTWNSSRKRWMAKICCDRKQVTLGQFKDLTAAGEAYAAASARLHGAFGRVSKAPD